jgi:hypothetical protein
MHSAESIFIIEYLREYEFIFETALAHESGGPGVLIDEKNWGSKISWHCPFNSSFVGCGLDKYETWTGPAGSGGAGTEDQELKIGLSFVTC